MDLLANELSVHGQFPDDRSFWDAIGRLMRMREVARRHGSDVYCSRNFRDVKPRAGVSLEEALGRLSVDRRRSFLSWLNRGGPFWDDSRRHREDDWLECRGDVVTDSSVGEAAFRELSGVSCGLVSLTPSDWDYSPIRVVRRSGDDESADTWTDLQNWRDANALAEGLRDAPLNARRWEDLHGAIARYSHLRFSPDCLKPLRGLPFSDGATREILTRLDVLNRFSRNRDADGAATPAARQLLQNHFVGEKAWFSDSSDSEKRDKRFRAKMTFRHPDRPRERIFCPWHGKVKIQQIRIHFSWPGPPIHVVYIGQKITRR